MKLTGNTIFITGGGSGIGRALAEALHKRGNNVIIGGRRRSHLDEVVGANPGMAAVELDITDAASIERVAAQLIADYPDLNVLINNAGVMLPDQAGGRIDDALMVSTITPGYRANHGQSCCLGPRHQCGAADRIWQHRNDTLERERTRRADHDCALPAWGVVGRGARSRLEDRATVFQ
jgi:NAD(P)-dependent dehydrogenase (short-subunit alcohol dehydrogenase family)